jgi:hypothetical protein
MRFELKPLSFSEVIDGAFKILRSNLALFLVMSLVLSLPSIWGGAMIQAAQMQMGTRAMPSLPPGFLLMMLLGVAGYVVLWGTVSAATVQLITGAEVSFGKAFRRFRPVLGRMLLAGFIATLVGFLFSLLLLVPGIIYWLRRSLFLPVLLVEDVGAGDALDRSRTLVKGGGGRMGRIFAVSLIVGVLGWVLKWGVGLLVPRALAGTFVGTLIPLLPQVVLTPVYIIALVLIYYDARIRDEGYDLELRAKGAAAAAPGPA